MVGGAELAGGGSVELLVAGNEVGSGGGVDRTAVADEVGCENGPVPLTGPKLCGGGIEVNAALEPVGMGKTPEADVEAKPPDAETDTGGGTPDSSEKVVSEGCPSWRGDCCPDGPGGRG